jgi:hypothetical protein
MNGKTSPCFFASHRCEVIPLIDLLISWKLMYQWNGTIVAMRIPYINEGFNYIRFVE